MSARAMSNHTCGLLLSEEHLADLVIHQLLVSSDRSCPASRLVSEAGETFRTLYQTSAEVPQLKQKNHLCSRCRLVCHHQKRYMSVTYM